MPDDSNGIYSVPAGTIVSTGDTILPSQHNPWANDSASAISARFSKDGRAPATGNWNINNFRLTNVGAPVAGGDAVNKTYADALDADKLDILQPSVDVASAATTDIGAAASQNVRVTGTTTITSFGTVASGTFRRVRFAGILTLTHNGTSLILPGAANIVTAAGDVGEFISEGSGNWRCVGYTLASGAALRVSGWEPIATKTPSASPTEAVTDLSAYEALRITGLVRPSTDGATFFIRTSTNNGSSYDSGASAYAVTRLSQQATAVSGAASSLTYLPLNVGITIGNAANEFLQFTVIIEQFNKSQWMSLTGDITGIDTTGAGFQERIGGFRQDTTARNAIQFGFTSGNIASGTIRVEGWRG